MLKRNSFSAGQFTQKVVGVARSGAAGAKRLARITKLKMDISSRKDSIRHTYAQIGKLYYEAHREEPEGFFTEYFRKIDIDMSEIADFEAEIAALREDAADAEFEPVAEATEKDAEPDIEVTIEIEPEEETSVGEPSTEGVQPEEE